MMLFEESYILSFVVLYFFFSGTTSADCDEIFTRHICVKLF